MRDAEPGSGCRFRSAAPERETSPPRSGLCVAEAALADPAAVPSTGRQRIFARTRGNALVTALLRPGPTSSCCICMILSSTL
eukprot:scaffold7417_cov258-Pinguiococcus_pyrenoidosus.AAC.6